MASQLAALCITASLLIGVALLSGAVARFCSAPGSPRKRIAEVGFFVGLWWAVSVGLTLLNKFLFSSFDNGHFHFPLTMSAMHFSLQWAIGGVLLLLRFGCSPAAIASTWMAVKTAEVEQGAPQLAGASGALRRGPPTLAVDRVRRETLVAGRFLVDRTRFLTGVALVGMLTAADVGLSNWAMVRVSVALYTVCKNTAVVFNLLFSVYMGLQKCSVSVTVVVFLIFGGVAMTAYHGEAGAESHPGARPADFDHLHGGGNATAVAVDHSHCAAPGFDDNQMSVPGVLAAIGAAMSTAGRWVILEALMRSLAEHVGSTRRSHGKGKDPLRLGAGAPAAGVVVSSAGGQSQPAGQDDGEAEAGPGLGSNSESPAAGAQAPVDAGASLPVVEAAALEPMRSPPVGAAAVLSRAGGAAQGDRVEEGDWLVAAAESSDGSGSESAEDGDVAVAGAVRVVRGPPGRAGGAAERKAAPHADIVLMQFLAAPVAMVLMALVAAVVETGCLFLADVWAHPQAAAIVVIGISGGGSAAFLMMFSEMAVVERTSALSMTIIGHAKEVVVIVVSILVYHTKLSAINVMGLVIALSGAAFYSYLKATAKAGSG